MDSLLKRMPVGPDSNISVDYFGGIAYIQVLIFIKEIASKVCGVKEETVESGMIIPAENGLKYLELKRQSFFKFWD